MKRVIHFFQLSYAALTALTVCSAEVDFTRDVRPILAGHCFKCHGQDEGSRKAGLRLDLRESALKAAKSGKMAIVLGDAEHSELIRRINATGEDDVMPPVSAKNPLSPAQKEILAKWITAGAEYKPHWAFIKPVQPSRPEVQNKSWPGNELDYFVLARMEKEQLTPSPRADKYSLVRRLYLDLVGFSPSPAQADAFANDPSAEAYERLVDSLLASPHYGERWARRWLDLARYADTNGYEKDRPRSMWPYRDWVIRALNADMPFDRFTIEQIAGDMLPDANTSQIIATGFHRNTMINEEGGIDPLEYRFYSMVDRVHVTATTWLGLTMGCAQCHTHKYDPIQHTEYYQFMALLNNADEPTMPMPDAKIEKRRKEIETKIASLEQDLVNKFPAGANIEWTTPGQAEFSSLNGADGEFLNDGSFRVTGKSPERDTYTLQFELSPRRVTHVQLEALPDDKVGKGGPGRTDHGNFVVSEFELEVQEAGAPAPRRVSLNKAEADFSQDGFPAENAIDGKADTGWAVGTDRDKRYARHAIFTLSEPLTLSSAARLQAKLVQNFGSYHTLGRFRVSFGNDLSKGATAQERSIEARDRKFSRWLQEEREKLVEWRPLRPAAAKSETPTLAIESDGAIFASGDFTKSDTYHISFKDVPAETRAIRLEVLPDERLPKGGPGTVHYEGPEGDFWISTLKLKAGTNEIALTNATESFANAGNNAAKAIDADLQSGWSIDGGQGRSHNAVFQLATPLESSSDLQLDLTCERYYAAGLGKFKIWITSEDRARASALSNGTYAAFLKYRSPEGIEHLLHSAEAAVDREKLLREFVRVAPELAAERKKIADLRATMPNHPTTLVMRERSDGHARTTQRHHRGEFLQAKEEVQPGVPAFLPPLPAGAPKNRLTLAKWLVSPENPLTARVVVNREWEAFFGRGLVRTVEDFGFQGELPTNQELLDWLAVEFVKDGWSLKKLHKLIVMSATYQQSSRVTPQLEERDPLNLLLARGPRFRLEAELIRDQALRESGLLSEKLGGPSVYPAQPAGVSTEGAYGALQWKLSPGGDRYRRGLYTFAKRTTPYAMTATFDGPSGEACLARRDRSNTPLQALTVMNDEVFVDCARALGRRAVQQPSGVQTKAKSLFRACLTRPPSETELNKITAFYQEQLRRFSAGELKASEIAGEGPEASLNEQAAWTSVARVLLNVDEAIVKE